MTKDQDTPDETKSKTDNVLPIAGNRFQRRVIEARKRMGWRKMIEDMDDDDVLPEDMEAFAQYDTKRRADHDARFLKLFEQHGECECDDCQEAIQDMNEPDARRREFDGSAFDDDDEEPNGYLLRIRRKLALKMAVQHHGGIGVAINVVATATLFEQFLARPEDEPSIESDKRGRRK